MAKNSGAPPLDSPLNCVQCKRKGKRAYRVRGSKFCQHHARTTDNLKDKPYIGIYMPAFYTKKLRSGLKDLVEEQIKQPMEDQVSLCEEVALMMTVASRAVALYDLAMTTDDAGLQDEAAANMVAAFRPVMDGKKTMATIVASLKDQLSVHDVMFLIDRIIEAIYMECEAAGQRAIADALVPRIQELSKITGPEGTALTPDADMKAMIDSVPLVTDDPFELEETGSP